MKKILKKIQEAKKKLFKKETNLKSKLKKRFEKIYLIENIT